MKYPNQTIQIKIETIKLVPLDSSIYEAGFWVDIPKKISPCQTQT